MSVRKFFETPIPVLVVLLAIVALILGFAPLNASAMQPAEMLMSSPVRTSAPTTAASITSVTPMVQSAVRTVRPIRYANDLAPKDKALAAIARGDARQAKLAAKKARQAAHREWQQAPAYKIQDGDTLYELVREFCTAKGRKVTDYAATAKSPWNKIENANLIRAGRTIHILGAAKKCTPAPAPTAIVNAAMSTDSATVNENTMALPQLTPRTPSEAVAAAKAMIGYRAGSSGMCQHMVGEYYGLPATGYATAAIAWNSVPDAYKHPGDANPPAGAMTYFNTSVNGHNALSLGNRQVISTDYPSTSHIGIVSIDYLDEHWGEYLGWASPYFNVGLPENPNPVPTATSVAPTSATTTTAKNWQDMTKHELLTAAEWHVGPQEFAQLDELINRESGWNPHADNPTSSAYGIPQALPGSKMATHGSDWEDNPITQLRWMRDYIEDRYGSISAALQHHDAHNWY